MLGVPATASPEEIKRRYRQLVKLAHPDAAGPGVELFLEIRRAYEVLGDPERRAAYDAQPGPAQGPGPGLGRRSREEAAAPVADRRGHRGDWRWAGDTLEDFARDQSGAAWPGPELPYPDSGDLPGWLWGTRSAPAAGSGAAAAARPRAAPPRTHLVELSLPEAFAGAEVEVEGVRVRIPPGARDQGRYRTGSPPLDLLVRLLPHPGYTVSGDDLATVVAVAPDLAAGGGEVRLAHPGGALIARLPPRVRPGQVLRLRGRGLPPTALRPAGDLLLRVEVGEAGPGGGRAG